MAHGDKKPNKGWFTWVKNKEGRNMIKGRLDRFLMSMTVIENFPYMATSVVRQTKSDHDAILLDIWGRKPKDQLKDPRLCFKYDECWAKDREAKEIINNAWNRSDLNIIGKVERQLKKEIRKLQWKINKVIDTSQRDHSAVALKEAHFKISHLYAKEEKYWAQRSQIKWLKECDRNTRYFHIRATSRLKKNNIAKLKDSNERWETNDWLPKDFTKGDIIQAIKQMDPRKAHGVDGPSGSFFKNSWEIDVVDGKGEGQVLDDSFVEENFPTKGHQRAWLKGHSAL
ncbi:hypothetical protein GOBAR_DD23979 [Gossypium barbadense]|nr:hypothetical protein GOBAR_DD23979 [Gossypium barbadense]